MRKLFKKFQGLRSFVTVSRVHDGKSTLITMNDGKMNTFDFKSLDGLQESVTSAQESSESILIVGNEKCFSAGFDLNIMTGPDKNRKANLIHEGCKLGLTLLESKIPVFMGCSGHALAMGSILLLCGDYRFGISNPKAKVGLNEVTIGVNLPILAVEVARMKMSPQNFNSNVVFGKLHSPITAIGDNGFLDEVINYDNYDDFVQEFVKKSGELLEKIKQPAFSEIKRNLKENEIKYIKETLEKDIEQYRN